MAPLKAIGLNNFTPASDPGNSLYYWADDLKATNTPWVRLWVDWTTLAPRAPADGVLRDPATDTDAPGGGWSPAYYLAYLDLQVRIAKAAGFGLILTFWLYPPWVNGGNANPYRLPLDAGIDSPWARYLEFLMLRYSPENPLNEGAFCDVLEVCNETDLAALPGDPQRRADATTTARMLVTADALRARNGLDRLLLAGPANTDSDGYQQFLDWLIADLRGLGFSGNATFLWTMHNYSDIYYGNNARAQDARGRLIPFWTGYPTGLAGPETCQIFMTEGGSLAADRQTQRRQVMERFDSYSDPVQGKGLAMFTQFLNVSSPVFDSGMRNYDVEGRGGATLDRTFPKRPLWRAWADR